MSKAKSKQEEALQFLDDLDNLSPVPSSGGSAAAASTANPGDAADVLKFIDEITLKSSEPTRTTPAPPERPASRAGTPTLRKATERVRVGSPSPNAIAAAQKAEGSASAAAHSANAPTRPNEPAKDAGKGWGGWGSVWSSASAALQQAKTVVDEGVKQLPNNEQAKKWSEGVMGYVPINKEQLEKFGKEFTTKGFSTLTEILNAVAPPISEHEVIQVRLSHDMEGYDGIESLVYKALARIMEQVDGGDLVVNSGSESKPRSKGETQQRNLNPVDGVDAAFRLAEANIQELIKSDPQKETSTETSAQNPTTYSSVYLRIQPFFSSIPTPGQSLSPKSPAKEGHLQFILYLSDPGHELAHSTVTQAVPSKWLDHWDKQDWVEDVVVDILRTGVETIGQEYIVARMGWIKEEGTKTAEELVEEK